MKSYRVPVKSRIIDIHRFEQNKRHTSCSYKENCKYIFKSKLLFLLNDFRKQGIGGKVINSQNKAWKFR